MKILKSSNKYRAVIGKMQLGVKPSRSCRFFCLYNTDDVGLKCGEAEYKIRGLLMTSILHRGIQVPIPLFSSSSRHVLRRPDKVLSGLLKALLFTTIYQVPSQGYGSRLLHPRRKILLIGRVPTDMALAYFGSESST